MTTPAAIVFFDGLCNLCEHSVQFIIRHDKEGYFHFASLQSAAGQQALAAIKNETGKAPDSVVLLEHGRYSAGSEAAVRIARHLNGGWKLLSVFRFVPAFLREPVYRLLANNRYRLFGKKQSCWLPTPALKQRFLDEL